MSRRDFADFICGDVVALGEDDRGCHGDQHGALLVERCDQPAHVGGLVELGDHYHAHRALGQRDEVDEHRGSGNVDAAAVLVGDVGAFAFLKQQARPVGIPDDVGAVGDIGVGLGE